MISLQEINKRLLEHEGYRRFPYRCTANKLTIGIGRNIEDCPFTPEELALVGENYMTEGISEDVAFKLLEKDIDKFTHQLEKNIPFFNKLDDERQYCLLDMIFNMGLGNKCKGLLSFKNMLKNLELGNYKQAAQECLNSKYGRELPIRAKRIANTIETGVFKW